MNEILRYIYLAFFISHIPISLLLDFQILFGKYYPELLQSVNIWYYTTHNDILLANPPLWLKSLVTTELLFQFPFFFYATYGLVYKNENIKIPGIFYGAHVSTTLIPILTEFYFSKNLSQSQRYQLIGFYFPYLFIPLLFSLDLALSKSLFAKKSDKKNN